MRLVGGNEDVTQRRLRMLWERRIINRFAFPLPRPHSEFVHYLDNRQAVELVVQYRRLSEIRPQMEEELRLNREANYRIGRWPAHERRVPAAQLDDFALALHAGEGQPEFSRPG